MQQPKVAIVCEFLTVMGGAENVVLALHKLYPNAPVYTGLYNPKKLPAFRDADVRTTWLQKLPKVLRKSHRFFPLFSSGAFSRLDLSEFDIIITSSYLNANHVQKSRPNQKIISYCHTPARYYWSHYDLYKKEPGFGILNPVIRLVLVLLVRPLRKRDYKAAQAVDVFIANSSETQRRIATYYGKPSTVVHPPVDTKRFSPSLTRGDHYVALGRQLPNKRFDLAIAACTKLSLPLRVFGDGPMHQQLVHLAGPSISFYTDRYGDASDAAVEASLNTAKGFIFPSDEDFGIVTVEALAAGCPVIGYKSGGTIDIVQQEQGSGVLFDVQTVDAVVEAIKQADATSFHPSTLQRKAKRFDSALFTSKMRKLITDADEVTRP